MLFYHFNFAFKRIGETVEGIELTSASSSSCLEEPNFLQDLDNDTLVVCAFIYPEQTTHYKNIIFYVDHENFTIYTGK